ncbi:MAG: beta-ketoacyl synthase chain length factor [Paracoccaceae bacterium]
MIGRVKVTALGFLAPGLDDVTALAAHLDGAEWEPESGWRASPDSLRPRQAKRLSGSIALSIAVSEQIAGSVPANGGWVFASSLGEGDTLNRILTSLSEPDIMIQPLRFQNAVHNAALGQWSIAMGAAGPGTSIAAQDATAGAGLLKAVMQVLLEGLTVGLVIFDEPLPEPLWERSPMAMPMAAALALAPTDDPETGLTLDLVQGPAAAPELPHQLADSGNPVRHVIPLLAALHARQTIDVIIPLPGEQALRVQSGGEDAG